VRGLAQMIERAVILAEGDPERTRLAEVAPALPMVRAAVPLPGGARPLAIENTSAQSSALQVRTPKPSSPHARDRPQALLGDAAMGTQAYQNKCVTFVSRRTSKFRSKRTLPNVRSGREPVLHSCASCYLGPVPPGGQHGRVSSPQRSLRAESHDLI
jgi:hypothetical protein